MAMQRWKRARRAVLGMLLTVLLGLGLGAWRPHSAMAQGKASASSLIKKGQGFFEEQRYEESVQTLSAALLRPGVHKATRIKVYQLLAYNYIVLQRTDEADGAVRGLLVIDESFELPETESPRFRDFFSKVREQWEEEGKPGLKTTSMVGMSSVKIKHTPPAQVDADKSVRLSGQIEDPEAIVAKVKMYYRPGTTGRFKSTRVKHAVRNFTVDIPARAVKPPLIEYYVEALDENGLPIATRGDAETPLRIAVPEEASVLTSPWLWVPVGVAVVAAIVIPVVVVTTQSSDSTVTVNVFE